MGQCYSVEFNPCHRPHLLTWQLFLASVVAICKFSPLLPLPSSSFHSIFYLAYFSVGDTV